MIYVTKMYLSTNTNQEVMDNLKRKRPEASKSIVTFWDALTEYSSILKQKAPISRHSTLGMAHIELISNKKDRFQGELEKLKEECDNDAEILKVVNSLTDIMLDKKEKVAWDKNEEVSRLYKTLSELLTTKIASQSGNVFNDMLGQSNSRSGSEESTHEVAQHGLLLDEFKKNTRTGFVVNKLLIGNDPFDQWARTRYARECKTYNDPISKNVMVGFLVTLSTAQAINEVLIGGCVLMLRYRDARPRELEDFIHCLDGPIIMGGVRQNHLPRDDPMTVDEIARRKTQRNAGIVYITKNKEKLWDDLFRLNRLSEKNSKILLDSFTEISEIAAAGDGLSRVIQLIGNIYDAESSMFEKIFMAGFTLFFRGIITSLKYNGFDATFVGLGFQNINSAVYDKIKLVIDKNIPFHEQQIRSPGPAGRMIYSGEMNEKLKYKADIDSWYNMLSSLVHSYERTHRLFNPDTDAILISLKRYEILNLCFVLLVSSEVQSGQYYISNPMQSQVPNTLELLDRLVDHLYILTLE